MFDVVLCAFTTNHGAIEDLSSNNLQFKQGHWKNCTEQLSFSHKLIRGRDNEGEKLNE